MSRHGKRERKHEAARLHVTRRVQWVRAHIPRTFLWNPEIVHGTGHIQVPRTG